MTPFAATIVRFLSRASGIGYYSPPPLAEHDEYRRLSVADSILRRAAMDARAEAVRLRLDLGGVERALKR